MNFRCKFVSSVLLAALGIVSLQAQQQPVIGVEITKIAVLTGNGKVALVSIDFPGSGYTSAPAVAIGAPDLPGGVQATATAEISINGAVSRINITNPGSGYSTTNVPTVTISGGGGTGAEASVRLGEPFSPPNESYGAARTPIAISAQAIGTFMNGSFIYSFFVNGISIGTTDAAIPFSSEPPTVLWAPPQPGSYFITVTATDGVSTISGLAVRYFAEGTVVNSPLTNTLVPQGSSVVLKADATVAQGFIRDIQFYDNGAAIGQPDRTIPYSFVYTVPGAVGQVHDITAKATSSTGAVLLESLPIKLNVVGAITPLPTCLISNPSDGLVLPIPLGSPPKPLPITVDATSPGGLISKVELYIDGVLFGTKNTYPYTFDWTPTVVGAYRLVALAYDDKNNVVASPLATIPIAAPPSIAITSPTNNATVIGGSPTVLSAVATDSNFDADGNPLTIISVQFFVNSVFVGSATTPTSGKTYSITTTLTQAKDEDGNPKGSTITALATNSGGITGTSAAIGVAVTAGGGGGGAPIGEPPTVALTWPAANTQLTVNQPLLLAAKASDTDGNIVSIQFVANDTILTTTSTYPYSTTWTPGSLGAYKLVAKATDSDGNVVPSSIVNVTVVDPSPNPPSVRIASPTNGASVGVGSTQTIQATATDAVSVQSVQFFVNGKAQNAADTTYPFTTNWAPATPGVYTLTARALNASGNPGTSPAVLVVVSDSAAEAVYTGTYSGITTGEAGNFAMIAGGEKAAFIAYSTLAKTAKVYRYLDVPVDVSGGYSLVDPDGKTLVSGLSGATGTNGTFDLGRLTFIGFDTRGFPASQPVASGYYAGKLTGKASSTVTALVGVDGSIMLHAEDGTFNDAGAGKLDALGQFNVATARGNRFTGKADPATRLLTGSLSGTGGGAFSGSPSTLSASAADKVSGFAQEIGSNIYVASKGNTYDQVLLQGVTASVTADPGQITRLSYVDLTDDIVQVEFSGAGRLELTLDNPTGPTTAVNYNQPGVTYMKGHAKIVITGANETTNVSVFTVGKLTAGNQSYIKSSVAYDGMADIAYIAILSDNGKFGGIRTANASYLASSGIAGICAPGVDVVGPVYVGDVNASDAAAPMLLLGSAQDVQVNGGDLWQSNGKAVQVSGITQLKFVDGTTSAGSALPAQFDQSPLEQDGVDVTAAVVVNPKL